MRSLMKWNGSFQCNFTQSSVHAIMEGFQSELIICVYNFYCNSRFCSNSLCTFIFFFYKHLWIGIQQSTLWLQVQCIATWIMFLERQHSLIMQMIGYGTKW